MSSISSHVGARIRAYRKLQNMNLQELADRIHKSRATVSKYENGEIIIDIETLYEISQVLRTHISSLLDYAPEPEEETTGRAHPINQSPFFRARRLYFYFYDGRSRRLKDGIIHNRENEYLPGGYEANLTLATLSQNGRSSDTFYAGSVTYSDMLIRFSFVNQFNTLEEDLLYIFNPLAATDETEGIICGISSADMVPCAFKCLVSLTPKEPSLKLLEALTITKKEWQKCQKYNMLVVEHG